MAAPLRLLVAEDDPAVVSFLERALPRLGCEAVFVATGAELLSRRGSCRPDAVLSDVGLAGPMDGVAAAWAILADEPSALVFLMTGDPAEAERARNLGLDVALLKPFSLDDLAEWLAPVRERAQIS